MVALALAGCDATLPSEWERSNEALLEQQEENAPPAPPAFPKRATLIEFEVAGQRDFRNAIDGATLGVENGVVRYVLVSRSPSGIENVSYEAIRCKTAEHRLYAIGHADGKWSLRPGNWRSIAESRQAHLRVLYREYFCPQSNPVASADEARFALQRGGNPWSKGFSGDALLGR